MTIVPKVNRRRLWVLLTAIWVIGVATFYWQDITVRYGASFATKADIDSRAQESRFLDCLNRANTNWLALKAKYGDECQTYARQECKGSMWCAEDRLADLCLKGKSAECGSMYFVSAEQLKDVDPTAARRKETLDHLSFYLSTDFSVPLKTALLLMFSIPIVLAFLPRAGRVLWKWITTG